ncbi:hypothetical protein RMATCC62417_03612 [Rhizopus microsporus]|nr:hypothetical protein RMATCC62417_03612 [Rhizopus microsporus]
MNNNNTVTVLTTNCSSCHAPLPVDSAYRICQTCREQVAAIRRRRRAEQEEQEGRPVRRRGRPRVEISQTIPAAYISQLSRLRPLDLGCMDKECSHCHALRWFDERQEISSMRNPTWESCCKQGSVQLQLLPGPPEYLKNLLAGTGAQGRHFKDSLCQYNAAFAFTSLGCDIVSAEERNANNNNRSGLNAFQIHGALCHRQGPLLSVGGNTSLYVQLYIYDPSYAPQRRSERNENLGNGNIESLSIVLAQCNLFARIYCHAYKILSNHESFSINSEKRSSNNGSTESGSPYIIISSSMRMHLIEGGDRRAQDLPTMEKVVAVIQIEYNDRGFRNIILTLRSNTIKESITTTVKINGMSLSCMVCILITLRMT